MSIYMQRTRSVALPTAIADQLRSSIKMGEARFPR